MFLIPIFPKKQKTTQNFETIVLYCDKPFGFSTKRKKTY